MRLSKVRRAHLDAMMKDTIFDAAGTLLEERGTDGLTMDRVATKVGVATASLYNYFRDKNELLQYTYKRIVEPFFQKLEEAAGEDLRAPEKLARILQAVSESAVRHKGLIKLLAGMGYDSDMRKICRPRFLQVLTPVFEQGIYEGLFRPLDPVDMSRIYVGGLSELFEFQNSGASESEVRRFAATLIDAALNGIHVEKDSVPGRVNTPLTNS